jgi:Restriction endonuclease
VTLRPLLPMLTPTDFHLLVGLLTQVSRPDGIDFELGSMVSDSVAEEERDVDITFMTPGEDGSTTVFEGIEVKRHKRPLDVGHIEQLCAKLVDMPAIKAAGIVSASGYTHAAANKAKHNGVTLYSLTDWRTPMDIGGVTIADQFAVQELGYEWVGPYHVHFNPRTALPDALLASIDINTPVYDKTGRFRCEKLGADLVG